jgi:outer membrane lipoprotein-sorting protein
LFELKSYKCTAEIKMYNNKNITQYIVTQYYVFPANFRVEIQSPKILKGVVTISNGKDIVMFNPGDSTGKPYRYENLSNLCGDSTILTEFFGNYVKSEKSSMVIEGGKYKFTTKIPSGNRYVDTETLTVNVFGKPEKLEIYDQKGILKLDLIYTDFQMNPKLEGKIFEVH